MTVGTETVPVIDKTMMTNETIDQIPGPDPVTMMIVITMTETDMTGDVRMSGIEIEKTVTGMIGLTGAGPEMMTIIMTMTPKIINVEGSMMMEIGLVMLTIGIQQGKSLLLTKLLIGYSPFGNMVDL